MAIAFFYAIGTAVGGITGPLLFGKLVETEDPGQVFWGYVLGAALMIAAGIVQAPIGVEAAQKDLEEVAKPLSAEAAEDAEGAGAGPRPTPRASRTPGRRRARATLRAPRPPERGRRFGPSEARSLYSPAEQSSSRVPDEDVHDEVDAIVAALREAGPEGLDRRTLGERVDCRLWGPGRFRHALSVAQSAGPSGPPRAAAMSRGRRSAAAAEPARGAAWRGPATRRNLESDQCPSAGRTGQGGR